MQETNISITIDVFACIHLIKKELQNEENTTSTSFYN